jgi:deoxyribodipyrimidine photo-lyase
MSLVVDELRLHASGDDEIPRTRGEFVLYWLQATHRVTDNFALAFAIEQANALRLPVLVYQELTDDYPWASDRFHTFILQGVIDLAEAFDSRGIQYAFALTQSWLIPLAKRAALVVTDLVPTAGVPGRIDSLRRDVGTPVIAVDSCTTIPLRYVGREYTNPTSIRSALLRALPRFLVHPTIPEPRIRQPIALPFTPSVPTDATIPALVASCAIDHTVPPVSAMRGGINAAQARLRRFLEYGFPRYLEAREDPVDDGTSRLSPYLRFGHISIHDVLLAVQEPDLPDQYDNFLEEALVWRELAHNFAFYNPTYRTIDGIPPWAMEELRRGEHDPRPAIYTTEQLEQAQTGDELWNAAQRAYLVDGWVHHAVRTLWGKAVVQWTPSIAECFRILVHLNNKYALDGCDANSYAGILWTFGKFDRPFYRRPIFGAVRYQSLKSARKRFDVRAYVQRYGAGTPTDATPADGAPAESLSAAS